MLATDTGKILQNAATRVMWSSAFHLDGSSSEDTAKPSISCLDWDVTFLDNEPVKSQTKDQYAEGRLQESKERLDVQETPIVLDDFLERIPDRERLDVDPRLPEQLSMSYVEQAFPKLSVPPALSAAVDSRNQADDAFTTQASIDGIFHTTTNEYYNSFGTMIFTYKNSVRPVIYDSMSLGTLKLPYADRVGEYRILSSRSHPYSCTDMLLAQITNERHDDIRQSMRLALIPLSLDAVRSPGANLRLIANRTAQLQNLYHYINKVLQGCQHLWEETYNLPTRYLNALADMLGDSGHSSVELLYQLAVTGNCGDKLSEWLREVVQEKVEPIK
jgi:anaphase-promoting complex subunit 4